VDAICTTPLQQSFGLSIKTSAIKLVAPKLSVAPEQEQLM